MWNQLEIEHSAQVHLNKGINQSVQQQQWMTMAQRLHRQYNTC